MIMVILTIHLALAAIYSLSILWLIVAAALKKASPRIKALAVMSFSITVGTGLGLVMVSPKAMAQLCTSTLIAAVFGGVAWTIYKRRITAMQPEKSAIY